MMNKSRLRLGLIFLMPVLFGCGIIYTNVHVPRSYRSATPADVQSQKSDPVVRGEACNRSIFFLVAWGDGGYAGATRDALKGQPEGAILYDVKADVTAKSYVVGLYTKVCTIVTGKVSAS